MIIEILREQLQQTIEMNQYYMSVITDMRNEIEVLRGVRQPEPPAIEKRGRVIRVEFGRVGKKESF